MLRLHISKHRSPYDTVGRRPNVDMLGLENTDLALDERGVPIADPFTMQAGKSNIFCRNFILFSMAALPYLLPSIPF